MCSFTSKPISSSICLHALYCILSIDRYKHYLNKTDREGDNEFSVSYSFMTEVVVSKNRKQS